MPIPTQTPSLPSVYTLKDSGVQTLADLDEFALGEVAKNLARMQKAVDIMSRRIGTLPPIDIDSAVVEGAKMADLSDENATWANEEVQRRLQTYVEKMGWYLWHAATILDDPDFENIVDGAKGEPFAELPYFVEVSNKGSQLAIYDLPDDGEGGVLHVLEADEGKGWFAFYTSPVEPKGSLAFHLFPIEDTANYGEELRMQIRETGQPDSVDVALHKNDSGRII